MQPLLAADSWLVADGRVRGWAEHWARFGAAAAAHGVEVDAFCASVAARLPRSGRWFPRVELAPGGELRLNVRPAPPAETVIVCLREPFADGRLAPRTKGPDLERCAAYRAAAAELGAGEALLAAQGGALLEGAFTSLLWWEDDVLCAVPDEAPILAGVTRALVLGLARDAGVAVRFARPGVDDILGCEVWLTSALHGIRAVSAWAPDGPAAAPAVRAAEWRSRLDALARPLSSL